MVCAPVRSIIPELKARRFINPYRRTNHALSLTNYVFSFFDKYSKQQILRFSITDKNSENLKIYQSLHCLLPMTVRKSGPTCGILECDCLHIYLIKL